MDDLVLGNIYASGGALAGAHQVHKSGLVLMLVGGCMPTFQLFHGQFLQLREQLKVSSSSSLWNYPYILKDKQDGPLGEAVLWWRSG